jgi:ATP/maltotriose-dependent transcriptional regulator MalT
MAIRIARQRRRALTPTEKSLGLTRCQAKILTLIMLGRSNKQIASELFVEETTVKTHLHRAYETLGVRTRTEAALAVERARHGD